MGNLIWLILPLILFLAFYIFIFTRKRESEIMRVNLRRIDWITYFAAIAGAVVFSSAMSEFGARIPESPWISMIPILLLAILLIIAFVRKAKTGRPIVKIIGDERMEVIYAKSARNALFVTYLALFVHLLITDADMLDTGWLLLVLASGLLVLIVSTLIYYYKKS